ncbi:MAG: dicarboxylate/amino acid:cation symporter [Pseudomonadota bacterium]
MFKQLLRLKLHWQILIAILLAIVAGTVADKNVAILGINSIDIYAFIGALFLNALKMLVVPLVVSSIIVGVAGIGSAGGVGRMGLKTMVYFMSTTLIAALVGLLMMKIFSPGMIDGLPAKEIIGLTADAAQITAKAQGKDTSDLVEVFLRMVPANVVAAAAEGEMLGLIMFSLLFGYFLARIGEPYAETQYAFWQGTLQIMMRITDLVMRFAPLGVFGLVAKVVAVSGLAAFKPLAVFFVTVLSGLALHMFVVLPLILKFIAKVSPIRHLRAMSPALLTAFSTSSSSATLPLNMDCAEKNAGISNRVVSFVLPLGATINMDGTALYECVVVLFIAQAYGVDLSVAQQIMIVILALLTSIGVAGIPAASLVAIAMILTSVGLPAEAIGLVLAVDRVLDMCRTTVNVYSDSVGASVIARSEGEISHLRD